jgi:hypothetical protein
LCDEFDVVEYRDMMTIIRDRVRAMVAKHMSLEQVKASRPTIDYEPRFGSKPGRWTTEMFVEAVYTNLSDDAAPKGTGAKAPRGAPRTSPKTLPQPGRSN